jgi:ATP-dependent protease ClpP protease subunit
MDPTIPPQSPILLAPIEDTSVKYFKQTVHVNIHHFYITDKIAEPARYLDMINIIKTAEAHDTIFIYLNTPGGNLSTTVQIMSAMNQCQGTIITSIEGEVCSAGTLIFLSGHKYIVNANSTFMIHNYSHMVDGKGNEVNTQVKYSEAYFKKLANDIYGGFLTKSEINDVLNGKDMWMESEEIIKRLGGIEFRTVHSKTEEAVDTVAKLPAQKVKKKKKLHDNKKAKKVLASNPTLYRRG